MKQEQSEEKAAKARAESAKEAPSPASRKPLAVSINLPFCPNTCQYCPYPSDYETALLMGAYCDALASEASASAAEMADHEVVSVYVDGGAASFVSAKLACDILETLHSISNFPRMQKAC
jgi:coproporphyrinogen III oxidase-like Fe-S oxidoreductase